VLSRTLLFGALLLFGAKIFFPGKWREFGQRFNRVINKILIAIALVYSAQVVWWLLQGR
jgi:hypothetical protein